MRKVVPFFAGVLLAAFIGAAGQYQPVAPAADAPTATPGALVAMAPTPTAAQPPPPTPTAQPSSQATETPAPPATPHPLPTATPQPQAAQDPLAGWGWKGMTVSPMREGFFTSQEFKESIDSIAALHVDSIALVIPYTQSGLRSTEVRRTYNTPTDAELAFAIDYVHAKGMKVMLKPHLRAADGTWQLHIDPPNRAAWFKSYGAIIKGYARIGEEHKVEVISIGAEMLSLTSELHNKSNTRYWTDLIKELRAIYSGKLTFSAHWGPGRELDEKAQIAFWPLLDYIGISAYFDFPTDGYSREEVHAQWAEWERTEVLPLQQRHNMPVIFTEVGYRSVSGTRLWPWDWTLGHVYDEEEQAALYDALFSYWSQRDYMKGAFIWEWRQNFPPGNTYYAVKGKLAEGVIGRWFGEKGGK